MDDQFQEEFSKKFHTKQAQLNEETVKKKRREYDRHHKIMQFSTSENVSSQKVINGSGEKQERKANESYAQLLKDQISMQKAVDENELTKSRKIDKENVAYNREQFPFGQEGVKVRDDVIEKYKASNYEIQRNMMSRFDKEAQQFRKNKARKYHKDYKESTSVRTPLHEKPLNESSNYSYAKLMSEEQAKMQRRLQLQLIRQKEKQEQEQRRRKRAMRRAQEKRKLKQFFRKRERENMIKVGNMLREIDFKLRDNSSRLADSLKTLRSDLRQQQKITDVRESALLQRIVRMNERSKASAKIPIILYNDKYYDARVYYDEAARLPERINRSEVKSQSQSMKVLLSILRKNDERLQNLAEEGSSYKEMSSSY